MKRAVLLTMLLAGVFAAAASAAPPKTSSPPTIEGKFQVGQTVTGTNGSWQNNPTAYAYQWQRCTSSGSGCADIAGATAKTYKLANADVDKTVRVLVTASNADGKATANSHPSPVISGSGAPSNTVRPTISGTAQVGETLTVSNGTWTGGGVSGYTYQWQRCDALGSACLPVAGATSQTYGVRTGDIGSTLRAEVTASNAAGKTTVNTDRTEVVADVPGSTVVVTTTAASNQPPSITFLSLTVRAKRVFVRYRVCDDSYGRVTVVARDQMPRRLAYAHRFTVTPSPCGTYAQSWPLLKRFQARGRFVVSLRAVDDAQQLSRLVSRGVTLR